MDAARSSPKLRTLISIANLLLLGTLLSAQSNLPSQPSLDARVEQLAKEERWADIVSLTQAVASRSADVEYYCGLALAQLGALDSARKTFSQAIKVYPHDKRFPAELAGIEFKQKNYSRTAFWLRRALRLDPADPYANEFLATTYFLQGNLDAALRYWNRVHKPQVKGVRLNPRPQVDSVLLDHAFAFAPASTLKLTELWTTEARVQALGIFPIYKFELSPREYGTFDVSFNSVEQNGLGSNKWQALLSFFRGAFQQTVYPEYFNIANSSTNFVSLARWDAQRRRGFASLSGPIRRDPKWRYQVNFDFRNENWIIRDSPGSNGAISGAFNFRKEGLSASVNSIPSWRWQWQSALEFVHRDFRDVLAGPAVSSMSVPDGPELKYFAQAGYELIRAPERGLATTAHVRSETGRLLSGSQDVFMKLEADAQLRWLPQQRGSDYETTAQFSYATSFGDLPIDEQFMLGLDPDNNLELRGHIGTQDGRKGNSPLARSFFLTSAQTDKILYSNGLITLRLGPFLDTAKVIDSDYVYQQQKWLFDVGVQAKISVLGVGFAVSYGKDLRSGTNAIYVSAR
ncbi:MAG TPA: hypothetical protein VG498_21340 [Terriglobales bacterium]|nr:hypothetical protein [Terriglobales bacterium]